MRLIDADALKEHIKKYTSVFTRYDWREICEMLNDAPTVDAVEVVRCKDCEHYYADPWGWGNCVFEGGVSRRTKTNDFCSWGERREDE